MLTNRFTSKPTTTSSTLKVAINVHLEPKMRAGYDSLLNGRSRVLAVSTPGAAAGDSLCDPAARLTYRVSGE